MQLAALVRAAAASVRVSLSDPQIDALVRYVELVFKWNRIANLTGARGLSEFVTAHIADCLAVVPHVREASVLDLGSGAGLPGVVIACARPDLEVTLLEARGKRARFLEQVRIELDLARVQVVHARIEAWRPSKKVECVVCRAYGSLAAFVHDTAGVLAPNGRLLAMKGANPATEIQALDPDQYVIEVINLDVPAWTLRHLVILERKPVAARAATL